MKLLPLWLVVVPSTLGLITWESGTPGQSDYKSFTIGLPSCAATCLSKAVKVSKCSPSDRACLCSDIPLDGGMYPCLTASCTIKEMLETRNFTGPACDIPVQDKSPSYVALSVSLCCVSGVVVGIRMLSKYVVGTGFGLDDLFTLLTTFVGLPSIILTIHGLVPNGLGRDVWTVEFDEITQFLRIFFALELMYFFQVTTLKLAILFFYLRIFPQSSIRRFIWGTIYVVALYGLSFLFVGIFQCQPIDYFWNQWDGEHVGRCANVNAIAWSNAVISVILDCWMIGLVIGEIRHLNMHWKKKIGVGLMLTVGTFVTVVSILRLQSLVDFTNSTNPTMDNIHVAQWSTVEITIGIICCCMPSIRALLKWLAPKLVGPTVHPSPAYESRGRGRSSPSHRKSLTSVKASEHGIVLSRSYTVESENNPGEEHGESAGIGLVNIVKPNPSAHGIDDTDDTTRLQVDHPPVVAGGFAPSPQHR